ncbi:NmrA-like domain-containing protein 1 [Aspergillus viridinutans]|uniref:NmrA-like domain-containing protein 1 n=1 Tax=Aspergillus viridinutans TaxID=75553 RepID=A0A9P3F8I4_ASPVI|nr:NmrA-like domain-containing protein 1 [Aspergillus viridinutans]GIK05066.1 NmrA-like domain-containing protein 1 [Aspergillus viridinutans]
MTVNSKVVVGATGKQGGSVARSLLQNKYFHVRCITRSPTSAKAKQLASLGAEMCQADGFSETDLLRAFNGSWGAFVNTNSENPELASNGRTDEELGKNIVRCAALAGVQHLVYTPTRN